MRIDLRLICQYPVVLCKRGYDVTIVYYDSTFVRLLTEISCQSLLAGQLLVQNLTSIDLPIIAFVYAKMYSVHNNISNVYINSIRRELLINFE